MGNQIDSSWKNPTPEQTRALGLVCKALGLKTPDTKFALLDISFKNMLSAMRDTNSDYGAPPVPPSLFEMAEMLLMSKGSLWYIQAKNDSAIISGARLLVEAVDFEFAVKQWGSQTATNVGIAACYCYTKFLSGGSQWFRYVPVFLGLNIGKIKSGSSLSVAASIVEETLRVYDKQALKDVRDSIHRTYEPRECIYPNCEKTLAPYKVLPREGDVKPYGDSGACSREHSHYECENPRCIAQAEKKGWKRMTHSFHTKIGKEHLVFIKK